VYAFLKRAMDVAAAAFGLAVLSPMLVAVALIVKLSSRGPVFFRQERPGRGGRPFRILKFRTMTDSRGAGGEPLPDGARLTGVGRFLRRWSLDEYPELFNVLVGDMSLVGPRPLLMQYLERYTPEQARRHEVRPGITGWAQIHGRNQQSWAERFELDVWYVDHRGLGLDLRILALTVFKVLRREGISAAGHETMPEFKGTQRPDRPAE
jgi:lipopolysaccharide/colanic/teichoic acid biosynthesis glycosyltransferase